MRNTLFALFLGVSTLALAPQAIQADDHRYL